MKCFYKNWPMHNIVAHPLMEVFNWLGMNGLATKVHDATLPSNQNKVKPKHKGSLNRYRLYLEGQRRTIPELAELMGYTYDGTRSTVDRMVRRGQVKKLEYATNTGMGRKPALYTWVK